MKNAERARVAAFTIVAKNYLALAKTLFESFRQFHPEVAFHLMVVDPGGLPWTDVKAMGMQLVDPLMIMSGEQFNDMAGRYDITELSTAIKPFVMQHLFSQGYEQAVYFDPDIVVMASLDELFADLEEANVLLTPHLLDPIPLDGLQPDEPAIMACGAYNLGFVAARNTPETARFLDWWSQRLIKLCKIAKEQGLFVDQKWIDLVPGMFAGVKILKDRGYNVAYWNVHARRPVIKDDRYYVETAEEPVPLRFFHYSGFNADKVETLSKFQNRVRVAPGSALATLLGDYARRLRANQHEAFRRLPYSPWAPTGVNVAGYLTAELGVGEAARGYVGSLQQAKVPVALNDFAVGTSSRSADRTLSGFSSDNPHPVNLICVNADQVGNFVRHVGPKYLEKRINVGFWWWELPRFPARWRGAFKHFDQVWVGSEFARAAVQASSPIPVVRVPPVVEVPPTRQLPRSHFGLSDDEVIFLFIFDVYSYFERKNPLALVRAFKRAFTSVEPVRLVIKCMNEQHDKPNMTRLAAEAEGARVTIMTGYLSKEEKNGLIAVSDCYVSLHRSEGFGYTMAEAMCLGKPCIATAWSGNTDFMSESNAYLVRYRLVQLDRDVGPYEKGQTWADPDVEHAALLMRRVVDHPLEARDKGARAAHDMQALHSVTAVAAYMREKLYGLPFQAIRRRRPLTQRIMLRVFASPEVRKWIGRVRRRMPSRLGDAIRAFVVRAGWY